MLKLNKAVFLLQSVCCDSCFYSCKSSSIANSWEWTPASLGKGCSHALHLGHVSPPHRHLCFVKYSRNYSRLRQHPQQWACTVILPWHAIFTAPFGQAVSVPAGGCRWNYQPHSWHTGKNHCFPHQFMFLAFWPCAAPTQRCQSLDP